MNPNKHILTIFCQPLLSLWIMVVVLTLNSSNGFAQDIVYTTLRRNVNVLANDLEHNLSNTQDSLILKNKFLFQRVRFLNSTTEKIFDFQPGVKSATISLRDLPLGNYAVMFYQANTIIVFEVDRLLHIKGHPKLKTSLADMSIGDIISDDDLASISDDLDFIKNRERPTLGFKTKNAHQLNAPPLESAYFTYNLSTSDRRMVQTREEYRRTHLRPNGKPYSD